MDPSHYYAQAGPSTQYSQHHSQDNDRGNQMQVLPVDNQAVQQYINDLFRNPTLPKAGLTSDPAFYAKAQHELFNVKHRLEQMILVNQQHAELAQVSTQIPYAPPIHLQHAPYVNTQGPPPHQHGVWNGSASGPWTYQQQSVYQQQPVYRQPAYPPPMTHAYAGQFVPDATTYDASYQQAQSVPQVVQPNSTQQHSAPSHPPQPQPQPQARPTQENPQSAQQRTVPLPNTGVQLQSQALPRAAPSASTSHTKNVQQPQPQLQPQRPVHSQSQQPAYPQRNPLQPSHQPNPASSSVVQKDRETTQKQLHYLQLLAQQHQRVQQSRPSSHQNSPASPQVTLPPVPSVPNTNASDSVLLQPVPQPAPAQRSSSPQQDPLAQVEYASTISPSPAKIRSRRPFSLHDLRPERRQSTAPSNSSSTPSREMNNEGGNTRGSEMATPTKAAKPLVNASNGLNPAEPGPSQKSPAETTSGLVSSHNHSNTPSPLAQSVQISAEPAPIPVDATIVSAVPNASTPALNKPIQPAPAPSSSTDGQKQSGSGSRMKIALENLHARGVDCVALVREAAQIAKVSVNDLPEETGPIDLSVPLFASGQPLDIWTSKLQVTRGQGDAVVRSIWDLMKRKAREIGIDAEILKHPEATTNEAPAESDRVTNYGNFIPPVDGAQVASSSSDSAAQKASQNVTGTQTPEIAPSAATLSTEPRPQSTQPQMQTEPTSTTQPTPTPVPVRPASAPLSPPKETRPAPVRQSSNAPPSVQPDPNAWQAYQAHLAQRHQYNPYPNGAPPSHMVQPIPEPPQQPQVHTPAYVPPNLGPQTRVPAQASQSQVPVLVPQSQPQPAKAKPRKTAALDYLRSLGVIISDGGMSEDSDNPPRKPAATKNEPIQTKDKGKGKAMEVDEPVAPVQPEPSNNGHVAPAPAPLVNVAGPSQVLKMPPSPSAPSIAVLPEPSLSPPSLLSTTGTITRPLTPISHIPAVAHAPTPAQPSVSTVGLLGPSTPTQASAPVQISVEAPPSPIPVAPSTNEDPAPRVSSRASEILSPPIASISALTLNVQSSPAEYTPLKRKRESRPSDVIEAGPGPNTEERARQQHAVNKHDQKRPKVAKRDSTTTGVGKKSTSSHLENPYPNIPRPDSPLPKNSWAQSYSTAMNAANRSDRPLFRPETPSDTASSPPKSKSKPVKRRMIMEVVIPLRKKGKVAAADLTLSDTGTERGEDLGLDELVHDIHDDTRTEQEPDLKLLRRRLRPHMCEWIGCIGPPVLSSVELLGVHLNRHHLNCRDPDTGYYMCRWANCTLQFKNPRRLWSHIAEKHVRHPLYCPYQGKWGRQVTQFRQINFNLDCDRTTSERYRMIVHVNRAHRGNPDAKLRVFAQPEDFPPDRVDPEEGVVLRPDAFPEGVPYFRIMGMALRYEVVPAQIPSQRHARIGPIILRNISAPTGFVSVPRQISRAPELPLPPVLASPMAARPQVRLGTVPPDALGEELEREAGPPPNKSPVRRITMAKGTKAAESGGKTKANPSSTLSYITITSDESSPEPENRGASGIRGQGRGRGRGRGRGGTNLTRSDRSMASQSPSSAPTKTPRLQFVIELPSRASGSSARK